MRVGVEGEFRTWKGEGSSDFCAVYLKPIPEKIFPASTPDLGLVHS